MSKQDFDFDSYHWDHDIDVTIIGAKNEFNRSLQVYDDFSGSLYVYGQEYGPIGIIRADSCESALEIAYDEFLVPIDSDEIPEAYGFWQYEEEGTFFLKDEDSSETYPFASADARQEYLQVLLEDRDLVEGYYYQANATGTGIVNAGYYEWLESFTQELAERFGITLEVIQE